MLLAAIKSKCPAELLASRDDVAIAALVSEGRTRVESCMIGIGTILATLGAAGGPFLDGLVQLGQVDRNVYWAMKLIEAGSLDIGAEATRAQVQALADARPEIAPAVAALLALAVVPDPVPVNDISNALNSAGY